MRPRQGAAIIFVMIAMALLATIGAAITTMSTRSVRTAFGQGDSEVALYAAETGAWIKVAEIAGSGDDTPITVPRSVDGGEATYTARVNDLGSGEYEVTGVGSSPSKRTRSVTIRVRTTPSSHTQAIFAYSEINLSQGKTSTYDSLTGLETNTGLAHIGVADGGTVIINDSTSTLDAEATGSPLGNIHLGSGASVSGGAAGTNYATVINSPYSNVPSPVVLPFPPGSSGLNISGGTGAALPPGAYGDVSVAGNGSYIELTDGTYVFNKLMLDENTQLRLAPSASNVVVYIDEQMEIIKGAIINPTSQPEALKFEVVGGTVDHKDLGTTGYYVLNAPFSDVTIQNSEVYGSIIGSNVKLDGDMGAGTPAWVHYDQNLAVTGGGGPGLQVLSVRWD